MAASDERFGVRLAAPPGIGPGGLDEIASVLSPVAGRPTGELSRALARGPLVVHTHISEADARQLVETFRALGARADIVEAVDPMARSPEPASASATRPLFAPADAALVDGAWRQVITGARPAVTSDSRPPPPAPAAPSPGVHEQDTRRLNVVTAGSLSQTQPMRSPGAASVPTSLQPAVPVPPAGASAAGAPTARLTLTPGPLAGAVFRPGSPQAPAPQTPGETPPSPADTQPIDTAVLASATATAVATTGEAAPRPVNDLATVRMSAAAPDATQPMRRPGQADTVELVDPVENAETRPFQRGTELPESSAADTARLPAAGGITLKQHGSVDAHTLPRAALDAEGADTARFAASEAADAPTFDPLDTGSIGSVQAGPKIFQLAAPPVGPTETGNLPMAARLDPVTNQTAAPVVVDASAAPPAGEFPTDAPRPGVYKLPGHRQRGQREPSVAVADPALRSTPPAGMPAEPPRAPAPPAPKAEPAVPAPRASGPSAPGPAPFPASPSTAAPRPVRSALPPAGVRAPSPNTTVASAASHHSPGTAAWMSVLVPGLGQVYNGQRERGILFALGTPLILPYLYGIYDAFKTAEDIARGKYAAPDPHSRQTAYVGQLALGLVMIFGTIVLALIARRPPVAPMVLPPPPVATAPATQAAQAPVTATTVVPAPARPPLGEGLDVPSLMKKGRMACNQGLFSECEEIMHEIIAREPGNRDAYNLLVEAAQQRQRKPPPASAGLP
jgi:TM2 domain-containing membrane protein YozV